MVFNENSSPKRKEQEHHANLGQQGDVEVRLNQSGSGRANDNTNKQIAQTFWQLEALEKSDSDGRQSQDQHELIKKCKVHCTASRILLMCNEK